MSWTKTSERLPDTNWSVLALRQEPGRARQMLVARLMGPKELPLSSECPGYEGCEHDEDEDVVWVPPGWYEWHAVDQTNWELDHITHWMSLPRWPEESAPQAETPAKAEEILGLLAKVGATLARTRDDEGCHPSFQVTYESVSILVIYRVLYETGTDDVVPELVLKCVDEAAIGKEIATEVVKPITFSGVGAALAQIASSVAESDAPAASTKLGEEISKQRGTQDD